MNIEELIQQYEEKLSSHDWYYVYSDDHRIWTSGEAQSRELNKLSKSLVDLGQATKEKELYNQYAPSDMRAS